VSDHYTIISADTHAGGSHAQYREYLDPQYRDDFDAWRSRYRNPFKDLRDDRRLRNWDNDMRSGQQLADGVVGEVIFPNTVPPFFPSFVLAAPPPKPDEYEHRMAGIRAHNRWLVDFCAAFPTQRRGIGQIFINNLDDALADAAWILEHGLRGGLLLPNIPPDATWIEHQIYDPYWEPLWDFCEDADLLVNIHGGTGAPDFGKVPSAPLLYIGEYAFISSGPSSTSSFLASSSVIHTSDSSWPRWARRGCHPFCPGSTSRSCGYGRPVRPASSSTDPSRSCPSPQRSTSTGTAG
jgi:hypothetical protein